MTKTDAMRTDADWEHLARTDAYWSVITDDQFRQKNLDADARARFFASGEEAIDALFRTIRTHVDPQFAPRRALDFGCGVGRVLLPLAGRCREVVGVDVSETMLAEAESNCREFGIGNAALVKSDDALSAVRGPFDLVHSVIVLQHIPPSRGVGIFRRLVDLIGPGGVGALHVTYAVPEPPPAPPPSSRWRVIGWALLSPLRRSAAAASEPEMQMNAYPIDTLLGVIHAAGARWLHAELSGADGHLGVHFYFRRGE